MIYTRAYTQSCPPNIDFESGTFAGWTCYTGTVASVNGVNEISFNYSGGPLSNRHTMYSSNPGDGMDEYGDFPKNCPNGSGHSIKLGNDAGGTESEGISFDFTIPANAHIYNLIYNYAVVFQDPAHLESEQPRLELEIRNITDGVLIGCSSFTFFANGSPIPGFELSDNPGSNTPVWFKRWTAVSINLDGLAGKTIRLFFKTADCTFRRHFGYAYLDVNTECSDKFAGADFCPDDTAVSVTAPYGYMSYRWYNSNFTQLLGQSQTLSFYPPPPANTTVAVILIPYNGYGCVDTLYTDLMDTLSYQANAGSDKLSCNNEKVQIGVPPKPGWSYQWTPSTGLSNPNISNPLANPGVTTTYELSIRHSGGGCASTDTVVVKAGVLDNNLTLLGKRAWCIGSGDSTILIVAPADSIQWFKNDVAISGANHTELRITSSGKYFARVFNAIGCVLNTVSEEIYISSIPRASFTVSNPEQCMLTHNFSFENTSTNAVGNMQYLWKFGDGNTSANRNVTHRYASPGTYNVTLFVSSGNVCSDSTSFIVTVFPNVLAAFTVAPVCVNLPSQIINNTLEADSPVSYLWNFGNGHISVLRNPPAQVYTTAGNYPVSLSVSSAQCPFPPHTLLKNLKVDEPRQAIRYPEQIAVVNLPLSLQARNFGSEVNWSPAVNLDNPGSFTPVFKGNREQLYQVEIKTLSGCLTTDTQMVKVHKSIEIYVPNTFTPNGDGRNDILKPYTIGIKQIKYFRLYNRWGQLIFETREMHKGWDGKFKGMPGEMQTVVWMLEGLGADNLIYKAKGTSVLLR